MPIFEYRGIDTGRIYEWLGPYKDRPESFYDPDNGEEFKLMLSAPNLLKSNLSDWQRGLSGAGAHDRNLNCTVYGEKHRDEILKTRGLVRESDLPKHYIEDKMTENERITKKLDDESDVFFERMQNLGLDKQGHDTLDRTRRTEEFWRQQVPSGDVKQNPEKYGITKE